MTSRSYGPYRGRIRSSLLASVLTFAVLGLLAIPSVPALAPSSGPSTAFRVAASSYTLINYTSTVDGTNLSYYEWLPNGFSNATPHPLAVYLHGLGHQGDELFTLDGGLDSIAAAQSDGFLLISLNTRNTEGFYVNSNFSGPQQTDVLDSIHSEESRHPVSNLYLFGSSMGATGAWSIAGNVPGLVSGIGVVSACTDAFEGGYWHYLYVPSGYAAYLNTTGGQGYGTSDFTRESYYLSPARFYPQNYSNISMYAAQGGNDTECPNNPEIFGYQMANNTFLNSTCLEVPTNWDEPRSCQTPFANLSLEHPGEYRWRFVYSANGVHSLNELNGTDLFAFWLGTVPPGLACARIEGTTPGLCPTDPVRFRESGLSSGSWGVTIDGNTLTASAEKPIRTSLVPGPYDLTPVATSGYHAVAPAVIVVTGGTLYVNITYLLNIVQVTFLETGLASGTSWSVTLGPTMQTSSTGTINFPVEADSTYLYVVSGVPGYRTTNWSGSVQVFGENVSLPIAWSPVTYTVWFNETGLPAGAAWTLSLQAGSVNLGGSYNGPSASFELANGSYPYSVMGPLTYVLPSQPPELQVAGADHVVQLVFTIANGTMRGTLSPASASLWIGRVSVLVSAGSFHVNETPGTYAVVVSAPGYRPFFGNFTALAVQTTWLNITLIPTPPTPRSPAADGPPYLLIGVSAAAILVVAVAVARLRNRRTSRR